MMRPLTLLSLIVALGTGLYLYQVKHRAQLLDQDINRTVKATGAARDRIGLLKAEWALLEDPQRLQDLANHHLQLQPLAPSQFVRMEDLAARLPAPQADPPPAEPTVAAATPAPSSVATPVPAPPLVSLAQVAGPVAAPPAAVARPAPPHPAKPTVVASLVKPRPLYAPMMPAYQASAVVVHPPTVQTASAMAPYSPPPPSPYVGSALGMARTGLAPPVPVPPAGLAGSSLGYPGAR